MKLKSYLINLDRSTDRLARASKAFATTRLKPQRISAVDGYAKDADFSQLYDTEATRAYMGRELLAGEIGCFLSHISAIEAFLATGEDYAYIFEDDAVILDQFDAVSDAAIALLEDDAEGPAWEVFNLCATSVKLSTPLCDIGGHRISRAHYFPMRCTGLLWTRSGAQRLLAEFKKIDAPYDIYIRRWVLRHNNAITVSPSVVTHFEGESVIESGPQDKRSKHQRVGFYPLKRLKRNFNEKFGAIRLKYMK